MTGQEWMEVIVMLLCFVLAALASGTETALTSVGRLRVRYLAEQGSQAAAILQRLRADPNRFLSTVLFTNTLALIVASTASALLSDSLFTRWGVAPEWRLWLTLLDSVALSIVLLIVPRSLRRRSPSLTPSASPWPRRFQSTGWRAFSARSCGRSRSSRGL